MLDKFADYEEDRAGIEGARETAGKIQKKPKEKQAMCCRMTVYVYT